MEDVIEKIKEKIAACKQTGDMFNLPSLSDSVVVIKTDVGSHGATLYQYITITA